MSTDILDSPPAYSAENALKAETAMTDAFLTDEVQSALKINVDEFTEKTALLNERFREVENLLKDFDNEKLSDPLAPTWTEYRNRYLGLVTKSERLAVSISKAAESYLTTIVKPAAAFHAAGKLTKDDLADITGEIRDFIDENKRNDEAAVIQRQDFATLISDIKTFRDNFAKFGEKKHSDNEARIQVLDSKLTKLNEELQTINGHLGRAQAALVGSGVGTGILVSATAFIPFVALAIFIAGAVAVGGSAIAVTAFSNQAKDKRKEIDAAKKEKDGLRADMDRIIQIRKDLKQIGENQVNDVILGLEFFREIWAAIATDCQRIGEYMESLEKRLDPKRERVPASLVTYLQNTTTLYRGLCKGLILYSMGVRDMQAKLKKDGHD